jgi:MFS family permease
MRSQEVVPNRYRHATIGIFDAGSIIAQVMPLVAWVLIKNTGNWRNAYYIMIAFQSVNLILLFVFYHPPSFAEKQAEHGKTKRQLIRDFDWLGLFMFIAGCTLFIVGVSWGGSMYPWTSATTLGPLIVGFMTLVGLGFYQRHGNIKEPLFPARLFRAKRQ